MSIKKKKLFKRSKLKIKKFEFIFEWMRACRINIHICIRICMRISINKIENATTCDFYLLAAGEAFLHKTIQINTIKIFS